MKKLRFIFTVAFIALSVFAYGEKSGEPYNIGEKEVIGQNKKEYDSNVSINSNVDKKNVIDKNEMKLKIREEKLNFLSALKITDVHLDSINSNDSMQYNIYIYTDNNKVDKEPKDIQQRNHNNYILFGIGGYHKIDAFKYIIDYTKEDKEKELTYSLHLGREISGEDRTNSDVSFDNYTGKIWYKNFELSIYHIMSDRKLPKVTTDDSIVLDSATYKNNSYRKEKATEAKLSYQIFKNNIENFDVGGTWYSKDVQPSSNTPKKEYQNYYYDVFGKYSKIFDVEDTSNYTEIDGSYYSDNIISKSVEETATSIKITGKDKLKLKKDASMDFDIKGLLEVVNKRERGETNLSISVGANKYKWFNDNLSFNFTIAKSRQNALIRDVEKSFVFDKDILPPLGLNTEDNLNIEATTYYNIKDINLSATVRNVNSANKTIFEEKDETLATTIGAINTIDYPYEIPVIVSSSAVNLNWQELELFGGITFDRDYKADLKISMNNAQNVPFMSNFKSNLNFKLNKDKHEGRIEGVYYGKMYGKRDLTAGEGLLNPIEGYMTANLYYNYQFNENLDIGFNVQNIFNETKYYKSFYPLNARKFELEFKILY